MMYRLQKKSVYEQHKKHLKRSAILKLQSPNGPLEGHDACSTFLSAQLSELLCNKAELDAVAQSTLLAEVEPVFNEADNLKLKTPPTKEFVKEVLFNSNLNAAPGSDGITSFLYKECWSILGDSLHQVVLAAWDRDDLTKSQRTSLTIFCSKPKSHIVPIHLINAEYPY